MFSKLEIIWEFWLFLKERKKFWLFPIVVFLILIGILLVFAETSTLGPLIYTLF